MHEAFCTHISAQPSRVDVFKYTGSTSPCISHKNMFMIVTPEGITGGKGGGGGTAVVSVPKKL
jgi:hypothetical protein